MSDNIERRDADSRIWVLGAPDPEMEAIEGLLRECGETVVYAADARGERVTAGAAYRGESLVTDVGNHPCTSGVTTVYLVECELLTPDVSCAHGEDICHPELADRTVWRLDHHRPGDPGYGRPPAEFLPASSIGQVIAELARIGRLPWPMRSTDYCPTAAGVQYAAADWADDPWETWIVSGRASSYEEGGAPWAPIPPHIVLTAAADHCLGAAYRGECPGVDPDALMRWRAATRAQFQGRHVDDVLADVERAKEALLAAPEVVLKQTTMCPWHALGHSPEQDCQNEDGTEYAEDCCRYVVARDMRTCPRCDGRGGATGASEADGYDPCGPCHAGPRGPVPELVEAATRLGVGYISGPLTQPDGRRKITCSGSAEQVRAFLEHWAPREGLTDIYGDPARGFAGGYLV